MKKILYVGDPHVRHNNIDESSALMNFVNDVSLTERPDVIVILGDLSDSFGTVRTVVVDFWKDWLDTLSEAQELRVLLGNHDMANSGNDDDSTNFLTIFNLLRKKNLHIIETPTVIGPFGYVPYMHSKDKFIENANALKQYGAKVIICHQDLDGGKYDNGFYAPNGADTNLLDYPLVIGGHIHLRQRFGKVILPGTARWLNVSDANQDKGLWLVDHDENGMILNEKFIDTSHVCVPIISKSWIEGQEIPTFPPNAKVTIELVGTSDWVYKQKAELKGKVSIQTKITNKKSSSKRQVGQSLEDFLVNHFDTITGLSKLDMIQYMRGLNIV